jgi:hypothetical protein
MYTQTHESGEGDEYTQISGGGGGGVGGNSIYIYIECEVWVCWVEQNTHTPNTQRWGLWFGVGVTKGVWCVVGLGGGGGGGVWGGGGGGGGGGLGGWWLVW